MKVMRMANQIGKSKLDLWSMLPNSEETLQALKYPLALNHGKSTQMYSRTMIPMCFFENFLEEESKRRFTEDSCNYFQPVFTDLGMCHAFNAKSVTALLLDSYYKESFFEAFKHDLNPYETMHHGTKSGHSFNFYLMGHHGIRITSHGKGLYGKDQPPSKFMLGLSNHKEYFNLKASSKIVQAGFKIILNVCHEILVFLNTVIMVQQKNMNHESLAIWRGAWHEVVSVFGPLQKRVQKVIEGIAGM